MWLTRITPCCYILLKENVILYIICSTSIIITDRQYAVISLGYRCGIRPINILLQWSSDILLKRFRLMCNNSGKNSWTRLDSCCKHKHVIVSAGGQLYIPAVWPRSALWWVWVVSSSRTGSGFGRQGTIQPGTETQDAAPCAAHAGKPDIFPHDLAELDNVSESRGSAGRRRVWNDHLQLRFWLQLGIQQRNVPWAGGLFLSCFNFLLQGYEQVSSLKSETKLWQCVW